MAGTSTGGWWRSDPRNPLRPTLFDKARAAVRPGRARTMVARRLLALVLVAAALGLALRGGDDADVTVVVAAVALRPGQPVTESQVSTRSLPAVAVPPAASRQRSDVVGRLVTGPVGAGEVFTTTRLVTSRLPAALVGDSDARLVPVQPADRAAAALLRPGDVVDVITDRSDGEHSSASASSEPVRALAEGAIVALIQRDSDSRSTEPTVVLALKSEAARLVAAAALTLPIALILR